MCRIVKPGYPHTLRQVLRPLRAVAALLLVSCAGLGWSVVGLPAQGDADEDLVSVELSTVGFDRTTGAPIVLLRDPESGKVLPIWVGSAEARAIALALHGISVPRPMTHDLMAQLLSELQAEVAEVVVHDLRDSVYIGGVRLRAAGEEKLREVDSRPSDALALALRTGAPIRVARKVFTMAPEVDFIAPEGPNQIVRTLGITVVSPTQVQRKQFRLGERAGVLVTSVSGRAGDEGLRRGDLIVEVNGEAVQEPMAFFEAIRATPRGGLIRIAYWREGERNELELPADLPPGQPQRERPLAV